MLTQAHLVYSPHHENVGITVSNCHKSTHLAFSWRVTSAGGGLCLGVGTIWDHQVFLTLVHEHGLESGVKLLAAHELAHLGLPRQ